jgi:hypothetical protein
LTNLLAQTHFVGISLRKFQGNVYRDQDLSGYHPKKLHFHSRSLP